MPDLIIDQDAIPYQIRRSPRARRLRLTVGPNGVEVVIPPRIRDREATSFVDEHRDWIESKLRKYRSLMADHLGPAKLEDGVTVPFRGEPTPLAVTITARAYPKVVDGDGFRVELPAGAPPSARETLIEKTLTAWLKRQARHDATDAIRQYGPPHGLVPTALHIKDQKRRWGSCTAAGVINLNWRLILAPAEVFDYVVIHELCHLRHRHHQPPFWEAVETVMPDFERHRRWLKARGHLLTLTRP